MKKVQMFDTCMKIKKKQTQGTVTIDFYFTPPRASYLLLPFLPIGDATLSLIKTPAPSKGNFYFSRNDTKEQEMFCIWFIMQINLLNAI